MKGFTEWFNNDFRRMPDPQELMSRDPLWERDLETMRVIVMHKKPKDDKK